jgi:hypothetical protein
VSQLAIAVDSPEWAIVSTYVNVYAALGYELPPMVAKFSGLPKSALRTRRWQQKLNDLTGAAKAGSVTAPQIRHELADAVIIL